MKPKPALLSPLIRSDVQGLILARLFMNPVFEYSITELAEFAITSVPTAMREVDRLAAASYIETRSVGRVRLIRANREHPLFSAIFQIVAHSYGPSTVLPQALAGLFGLQRALIHGQWAERLAQIPGDIPESIDLLLIGNMNRIDSAKSLVPAEVALGKRFNLQFATDWDWQREASEWLVQIKSGHLYEISLG